MKRTKGGANAPLPQAWLAVGRATIVGSNISVRSTTASLVTSMLENTAIAWPLFGLLYAVTVCGSNPKIKSRSEQVPSHWSQVWRRRPTLGEVKTQSVGWLRLDRFRYSRRLCAYPAPLQSRWRRLWEMSRRGSAIARRNEDGSSEIGRGCVDVNEKRSQK